MTKSALSKLATLIIVLLIVLGCVPRQGAKGLNCPYDPSLVQTSTPPVTAPVLETLANGTRLVLAPMGGLDLVTVQVAYGSGSRHDVISGTAHFLEHMVFKGTARRPNATDLTSELDSLGAAYNAGTGDEYTRYFVKLESSHVAQAVDILHDMLTSSLFRESDVNTERGAILQEERIYSESAGRISHFNLMKLMYPNDGLGRDGPTIVKGLERLTASDLSGFWHRLYVPANTVVVVAGKFDARLVREVVGATFGRMPSVAWAGQRHAVPTFTPGPHFSVATHPGAAKVSLNLGFPGYGVNDVNRNNVSLDVIAAILGGSMGSRLFVEVRERLGLAYSIGAFSSNDSDTGQFVVSGGLDADKVDQALTVIVRELKRLKDEPVGKAELHRAIEGIRMGNLMSYETSDQAANNYSGQVLSRGFISTPNDGLDAATVTPAEIQATAREVLRASRLYLSVVGPSGKGANYDAIVRQLGE
jgi:predicted Zn-dependent peptidase